MVFYLGFKMNVGQGELGYIDLGLTMTLVPLVMATRELSDEKMAFWIFPMTSEKSMTRRYIKNAVLFQNSNKIISRFLSFKKVMCLCIKYRSRKIFVIMWIF